MNKTIWILLIGLIGIVGCNSNSSSQEYTFAAQFAELQALDQEFNASFKLEQLDRTMVPLENIDSLLEQLEKKKKEHKKKQNKYIIFFNKKKNIHPTLKKNVPIRTENRRYRISY